MSHVSETDDSLRSTERFSITLTLELAEMVHTIAWSGQYATGSEVIRNALRRIDARNQAVDAWLQNEVVPAYTKLKADPSRALTGNQLPEVMAARRKARREITR